MASLDFESLFTNTPLYETINNCVSDLHNKNLYNAKLNKRDLFKFLETGTSKSSLIFEYLLYKKVDGLTMGSSFVPLLQTHFYVITKKNGWMIVQSILNL